MKFQAALAYECFNCTTTFTEADRDWDVAIGTGQCPKCRKSLRDFPIPVQHQKMPPESTSDFAGADKPVNTLAATAKQPDYLAIARFGFLRLIRVFFGILFALQIISLLPVLTWLQQTNAVTGNMYTQVFVKVIAMAFFGWLFFKLRNFINRLHAKKYGVPHPVLAKNKWAL
jgi:hypothetical protein